MSDFKDIWTSDEDAGKLSEEQLMAYLEGRLPEAERHQVESLLSSEGMESDALEGLQRLSPDEAKGMKRKLYVALQKTLEKKRRVKHRGMSSQQWNLMAIATLLLLAVICFTVFWMMRHQ